MSKLMNDYDQKTNESSRTKKKEGKYIEMEDQGDQQQDNNEDQEESNDYKSQQMQQIIQMQSQQSTNENSNNVKQTNISRLDQINEISNNNNKSSVNLDLELQQNNINKVILNKDVQNNNNNTNLNQQNQEEMTNEQYKADNFLVGGGHTLLFQRNNVNESTLNQIDNNDNQQGSQQDQIQNNENKVQKEQNEQLLQDHDDVTSQILSGNLRLVYFSKKIPRYIPWITLSLSVLLGASIPTSILLINASRYVKAFWRFFMIVFWIIPFCVYEYYDPSSQRFYKFSYIFKIDHLKQAYISSLGSSIWFTLILFSFDYTSVSHSFLLGSLSNFFMSAVRSFKKGSKKIELEIVGLVLVIIGVILILVDSITMDELQSDKRYQGFDMIEFLEKPWWQRIIVGDILCLLTSYIVCRFGMLKNEGQLIYPTYLNLLIMSVMTSMNLFLVSLMTGCSFSSDSDGVFALFTLKYFFIYLALSLFSGLGLILSYIYIAKFFEPIVSASAYLFEPIISTILIYMFNIEFLPGPFACLGYVFVLPGNFLILLTRHLIQIRMNKIKENQTISIKK